MEDLHREERKYAKVIYSVPEAETSSARVL
jgi:hypothetical protein